MRHLVLNIMLPGLNNEVIYRSTPGSHLSQIPVGRLVAAVACVSTAALKRFPADLNRDSQG